jgi:hypothetical protein
MRLLFLTGQSGNSKKSPVDTFYFDIEQKVRRSPHAYGNVLSVVVNPGCFPGAKPAPRTGEPSCYSAEGQLENQGRWRRGGAFGRLVDSQRWSYWDF